MSITPTFSRGYLAVVTALFALSEKHRRYTRVIVLGTSGGDGTTTWEVLLSPATTTETTDTTTETTTPGTTATTPETVTTTTPRTTGIVDGFTALELLNVLDVSQEQLFNLHSCGEYIAMVGGGSRALKPRPQNLKPYP
jgi:hypothetical protein